MKTFREGSLTRTAWDFLVVLLILGGCVLVTYQVAFEHRPTVVGSIVVYLLDLLLLLDVVMSYGAEDRRGLVDGRFIVDLVATLPLDALFLPLHELEIAGVSCVLLMRLTRLVRAARLNRVFRRWARLSWANPGLLRIARLAVVVFLVMHAVACLWFFVPYAEGFPVDSWPVREAIHESAPATQYIRSLYWTVVTMSTVGYGDITPTRDMEYVLAMCVMLAGASIYAFVIANIASMISNLDAAKVAYWSRVDIATQYLRGRNAPAALRDRLRDYYEYIWARNRGLSEQELFADLPRQLRLEILLHLTRDLVERVPLFRHCSDALRNVLLLSLRPHVFSPGVAIVQEGEIGDAIHFVSHCTVAISSAGGERSHGTLESGDYFGDLSMMLGELRTATARAIDYCDVLLLSRDDFDRIKRQYPEFREVLKKSSSERSGRRSELMLEGVVL